MKHEWDHDAVCIHCGHDGAESWHLRQLGYDTPREPCPVWHEDTRAENRRRYLPPPEHDDGGDPEFGLVDADVGDWDD